MLRGFHDVTLVDMIGEAGPTSSMAEMSNLRLQWPTSVLTGMTQRQADLEALRQKCKSRFHNSQAWSCMYCGRSIIHDMARHVSKYHLDLGQLWRCPVLWCSEWKATPPGLHRSYLRATPRGYLSQNCQSVEVVPSVTRSAWNTALKTNVSSISTDMVLLSEHGAQLVHHYRVFGDCVLHGSRSVAKRAGTRVMDPVRHQVDRLRRPLGLRTARWMTILRPGKLLGL